MQSGRMKRWTVRSMLALAATTAMTGVAHAATDSWIGGGATASWSEDANWLFNRVATPPTGNGTTIANDNLIFASPTTNGFLTLINDLPAGTVLPTITFDISAGAYDLTGNALSLSGSSNKSVLNNSAATETIEFPLTITGSRTIAATAGPIVLKGALTGSSGGAIFTGPFTTTLLAPATYIQPSSTNTSGTQIQSGILQIGTGGSLPTVAAGGTYRHGFGRPGRNRNRRRTRTRGCQWPGQSKHQSPGRRQRLDPRHRRSDRRRKHHLHPHHR